MTKSTRIWRIAWQLSKEKGTYGRDIKVVTWISLSSYMILSKLINGFLKVEYEEWSDSWARREGHMAETSKALPIPRIVSLQSDNPGNNGLSLWQWPRQCPKMSNNVWPLWHKTGRWGGGAGLIHENGETFGKRASATIQSFIHTRTNHP